MSTTEEATAHSQMWKHEDFVAWATEEGFLTGKEKPTVAIAVFAAKRAAYRKTPRYRSLIDDHKSANADAVAERKAERAEAAAERKADRDAKREAAKAAKAKAAAAKPKATKAPAKKTAAKKTAAKKTATKRTGAKAKGGEENPFG